MKCVVTNTFNAKETYESYPPCMVVKNTTKFSLYMHLSLQFFSDSPARDVPIQPVQCWCPGLAITNVKYKYIFQIKYAESIVSNSTRKVAWFEITKMLIAV